MSCGRSNNTSMGSKCAKEVFRWGSWRFAPVTSPLFFSIPSSHIQTHCIAYLTAGRRRSICRTGELGVGSFYENCSKIRRWYAVMGIQFKIQKWFLASWPVDLKTWLLLELWDEPWMPPTPGLGLQVSKIRMRSYEYCTVCFLYL